MSSHARNPLLVSGRRPTPAQEMRQKGKTNSLLLRESFFSLRGVQDRPVSVATEFMESDFEDDTLSDVEHADYDGRHAELDRHDEHEDNFKDDDDEHDYYYGHNTHDEVRGNGDTSPRRSLDSGQPSFTTVSSYDEVPTPRSSRLLPAGVFPPVDGVGGRGGNKHSVEGPRGPHLFRISTLSAEFADALTLSPMTPQVTMSFPSASYPASTAAPATVLPHGITPLPPTTRGRGWPVSRDAPFRFITEADEAAGALDAGHLASWTPECVAQWMLQAGLELTVCERFVENDITGGILITLKFEDLKELGIQSFGLRTVVWDQISVLKSGRTAASAAATAESSSVSAPAAGTGPSPTRAAASFAVEPDTDIDEEPDRSVRHELRNILRGETSRSPPLVQDPRAEKQASPSLSSSSSSTSSTPRQQLQQPQQQQPLRRRASSRRKKPAGGRMDDIITPLESVSIVGIEQVLPRPHQCSKGENCSKYRRYQRMLEAIRQEHPHADACGGGGSGRLSGDSGGGNDGSGGSGPGVLVIAGDLGSLRTPGRTGAVDDDDIFRPVSDAIPSVVASSDILGPGIMPPAAAAQLHADSLRTVLARDPQDNVRQFLAFQQASGGAEVPPTPPFELYPSSAPTSPAMPQQQHYAPAAYERLRSLPRLAIPPTGASKQQQQQVPRSALTASAAPTSGTSYTNTAIEESPDRDRGGLTPTPTGLGGSASGGGDGLLYRFGTPFTEVDVPVTAVPAGPIAREVSQSVPPNMSYRTGNSGGNNGNAQPLMRTMSRASARRPSFPVLPALAENPALPAPIMQQQLQQQRMVHQYPVHQRAASAIGYRVGTPQQGSSGGGAAPAGRPLQPPPRVRYPWSSDRMAFEKAEAPRSLARAAVPLGMSVSTASAPSAASVALSSAASVSTASLASALSTTPASSASTALTSAASSIFGTGISYQGHVKKRRTKMLRHEWHDRFVTLRGTRMAVHKDAASAHDRTLEYIDIDDYAIACSASAASSRKLSAAFKAMHLRQASASSSASGGGTGGADKADVAAFAFQLIPQDTASRGMRLRKRDSTLPASATATTASGAASSSASVLTASTASTAPPPADAANGTGKTHHFAVKSRDDRIEWMRELMLAKAMRQKGEGYEVSVNGNMI